MTLGQRILASIERKPKIDGSRATRLIILTVLIFFVWSFFAPIDEVVRGVGRVAPAMKSQVVQNLEGGIVKRIFVVEGDIVEAGQKILTMDGDKFRSAYRELEEQRLALLLKLERLDAEQDILSGFDPSPELVKQAAQYAASEKSLFNARQEELTSKLSNFEKKMSFADKEVTMLEPMVEQSVVPEVELLKARRSLLDVRTSISKLLSEFEIKRSQEYAEALVQLRQIEEQLKAREDQLQRTEVVSPVRGVVNKVLTTTIGGVVAPGDPLVEILPLEQPLRIEGRISPRDIGFVYTGMEGNIKLTAFDYSVYGTLPGHVVHVGADTIVDEAERQPQPYFEVFVELDRTTLEGPSGTVKVRPGMQAEVELKSGKRTVLQYLLKPLFKASVALTER